MKKFKKRTASAAALLVCLGLSFDQVSLLSVNSADKNTSEMKKIIIEDHFTPSENIKNMNSNILKEDICNDLGSIRYDNTIQSVSFYNSENGKISFVLPELNKAYSYQLYSRYNDEGFKKALDINEKNFSAELPSYVVTADFMIVKEDDEHIRTKSKIVTFRKNDEYYEEVSVDSDEDMIPDSYEVIEGTDPYNADSDGDGFSDGYEFLVLYTDPLKKEKNKDSDRDGLKDSEEMKLKSDPYLKDTDFDGKSDKKDKDPLITNKKIKNDLNDSITIHTGRFDCIERETPENRECSEKISCILNGNIKLQKVGNKSTVFLYSSEGKCSAMITSDGNENIVNTYSYDSDKLSSVTHNRNRYDFSYDDDNELSNISVGNYILYSKERKNEFAPSNKENTGKPTQNVSENNYEAFIPENIKYNLTNSEYGPENITYADGKTLDYKYDKNAEITSVSENSHKSASYEYDASGQLIRENNAAAGSTYLYSYDSCSNILSVTEYEYTEKEPKKITSKTSFEYTDGSWNDLLTFYNDQKLTYDKYGCPLGYRDGMKLEWGEEKKLKSISSEKNVTEYTYNDAAQRISKKANGKATQYVYENEKLVSELSDNEIIRYFYDESENILGFEYNQNKYYYEKNGLNDVERIVDTEHNIICSYTYDAFGNIVLTEGDTKTAKINPFRYRSCYYDEESGFYYLNSRYYDPLTRRFISPDDAEYFGKKRSAAGYNLFAYCENNPVMYTDPTGNMLSFNRFGRISGTFEFEPEYDESKWNGFRRLKSNCYGYALNIFANDRSWGPDQYISLDPGTLSGKSFPLQNGETWGEKIVNAVLDDIETINSDMSASTGLYMNAWMWKYSCPVFDTGYDIALVLAVNGNELTDYHWYRSNGNGKWSHKRGATNVIDFDASGNTIDDPMYADRNYVNINYNEYVTSFRLNWSYI